MNSAGKHATATPEPEPPDPEGELKAFRVRAKAAFEPALLELLSDETRKAQRSLLALSFVLILFGMGAVRLSGPVRQFGLEIAINEFTLLTSLVAICLYFEVLVTIRCFADWRIYRLRTSIADLDLAALASEVSATSRDMAPDVAELARPIDETLEANRLRAVEGWGQDRSIDASQPTLQELERARPAREALEQLRRRRAEVRAFVARSNWFRRQLSAIRLARTVRIVWEMAFPLAFGALALWSGARIAWK